MDMLRAFEILEVSASSSLSEIKQAYRDLAAVWHPDRHAQNPRLHQRALEKIKELNAAYAYICSQKTELGEQINDLTEEVQEKDSTIGEQPSVKKPAVQDWERKFSKAKSPKTAAELGSHQKSTREKDNFIDKQPTIVKWSILLNGCLLHALFSAEGIFFPWNWKTHPITAFLAMIGYAIPGILLSVLLITPIFHFWYESPRKRPKISHVICAVYIGLVIRIGWPYILSFYEFIGK